MKVKLKRNKVLNLILILNKKNLRSVSAKDIINIRSDFNSINLNNYVVSIQNTNYAVENLTNEFYTYLATVLIELDPIDD